MMKLRKTISALCAVAMLATALPAASAAKVEPRSEYAGKTVPVQVVEETETGMVSRMIEVAIPEGATETEKNAIIHVAAFGQNVASARSLRSANQDIDFLSLITDEIRVKHEPVRVGGGTLSRAVDKIYIHVEIKSLDRRQTTLSFQLRNAKKPSVTSEWKNIDINDAAWEVYIASRNIPLVAKESVDVYAKTNIGSGAYLSSCYVCGIS